MSTTNSIIKDLSIIIDNSKNASGFQLEDFEKIETLKFAKKNDLWIDNFYSLGLYTGVNGHENTIALNPIFHCVFKSNNLMNCRQLISKFLEKIELHNLLFPLTRYEIVGFEGLDNGMDRTPIINPIIKQDYLRDVEQASEEEIEKFMVSLGYRKTTPISYVNDDYLVYDLFPRNVLKDKNGIIYVIDADFKRIADLV